MKLTFEIIQKLSEKYGECLSIAHSYGEPGYHTDKEAILFDDWNKYPSHVMDAIEKQFEIEWLDEWLIDYDNGCKAYRCSPSSYHWKPSYKFIDDCSFVTRDTVNDYAEEYLTQLINNPNDVNTFDNFDPEDYGFEKLNDYPYENGWFDGQNDDPKSVLKKLLDRYPEGEFLFSDFENSQFYSKFSVYGRNLS
jgi:hypothetical protein